MHNQFGFTKLLVWDLDATAAFYKAVASLEELVRVEDEIAGRKIQEILFNPSHEGAATFVLLKFLDAPRASKDEVILGFITDDVDAFARRAVAAGGTEVQAARDMPAHGVRVAFVTDVEGHLIEVVQMLQPAG
ncbi:VOC family protein [Nitrospirillum bahiense]|uniref:Putative enzyme related to lactoylglutathione lyase n=1 Tax=Nitrospirillum amazonense TaxID=28077 RepID=A0A560FVM1_9PROT|nr:VOC family protein [Nitrospirillum amazonense]TWB25693.1 putative enzyme related to lactoylglutathione lyase [Nitrospirillum amazonense]